jgi:tRNA pseudouridine55 synthase
MNEPLTDGAAPAGLVVIDKPAGMTSARAVAIVRRRARGARTGHAGTLDPLATGVLVVGVGRSATALLAEVMEGEKRYVTVIDLSAFTATDDAEAPREEVAVAAPPDDAAIRSALAGFRGTFLQQPPPFSAVKVGGRRAYRLARRGAAPEIPARPVTVHEIALRAYRWPRLEIEVRCAKGFYVRRLARDLGARLGTGGYCLSIRRTAVGPFTIDEAIVPDDLPDPLTDRMLIPAPRARQRLASPAPRAAEGRASG